MTTLLLNNQFKQFDENGTPLAAGKLYTYDPGTTIPRPTYKDVDLTTLHTNPIILDSWGEETIYIDGDTKVVVTDSDDVTIRTYSSFEDTGGSVSTTTPVIPSPGDAVYRATADETGYIKVRLPMDEWPDTKLSFDVIVYDNAADESFTMHLSGKAEDATSSWKTTTAITNSTLDYAVQFGHDGTYPAVYIGAVDTIWGKPQIAVANLLAGGTNFAYETWDTDWEISVTTTLGTITGTPTLQRKYELASDAETITGTNKTKATQPKGVKAAIDDAFDNATSEWQILTVTAANITNYNLGIRYRLIDNGASLQISGSVQRTGTVSSSVEIGTLAEGYRPTRQQGGCYSYSDQTTLTYEPASFLTTPSYELTLYDVDEWRLNFPCWINAVIAMD